MVDTLDSEIVEAVANQQTRILEFLRKEYSAAEEREDSMGGAVIMNALQNITGWTDEQVQNILSGLPERSENAEPVTTGSQ